jgi:hypothetical protein
VDAASPVAGKSWRDKVTAELDRWGITGVGPLQRSANRTSEVAWKDAILAVLAAISDAAPFVVVLLDEFPHMLDAIARTIGYAECRDVMNLLRAAREAHPNLRFVFTGSIGLHHILEEVRDGSWAPVNDLGTIEVHTLALEDSVFLARTLIENEGVPCSEEHDLAAIASEIARLTDSAPFYIHLLVSDLKSDGRPLTVDMVESVLAAACSSPQDPWSLRHTERRLRDYYGDDDRVAAALLDMVAVQGSATMHELSRVASALDPPADDGKVRWLLEALQRDHYLVWTGEAFMLRTSFLRRVWKSLRYLPAEP